MLKFLEVNNRVLCGLLLSTIMLVGCQPEPTEGVAVEQAADESSEITETSNATMTVSEEDVSGDINESSEADEKPSSGEEAAITKKEAAAVKSVEVSIEDNKVKPENIFDYANPDKYAESYTQTIYPKAGAHPTFSGYPVASFDTLYFDEWIGCCPRATNDLLLANVPTGNKKQLETYANENECEIRDLSSEDMKYSYVKEGRDLPVADSYILLQCVMSDETEEYS